MKIKQRTKKKKHLGKIIILIVLVGIVAVIAYYYYLEPKPGEPWKWVTSGPFSINKSQYKLGEPIFMVVSNLQPTDVGQIVIVDPKGDTYSTIPFNGTTKSSFKQFFVFNTQYKLGLCNATSLAGHWTIFFKGVHYKQIPLEVINEFLPGQSNTTEGLDTIPKGTGQC